MTENKNIIEAINRRLDNMSIQKLRIMLILALELNRNEVRKEA